MKLAEWHLAYSKHSINVNNYYYQDHNFLGFSPDLFNQSLPSGTGTFKTSILCDSDAHRGLDSPASVCPIRTGIRLPQPNNHTLGRC